MGSSCSEASPRLRASATKSPKTPFTIWNPNVKSSPGGLRDFQVACWSAQILHLEKRGTLHSGPELATRKLDAPLSARQFLFDVRTHLHYLNGQDQNTLTYQRQEQMAGLSQTGSRPSRGLDARLLPPGSGRVRLVTILDGQNRYRPCFPPQPFSHPKVTDPRRPLQNHAGKDRLEGFRILELPAAAGTVPGHRASRHRFASRDGAPDPGSPAGAGKIGSRPCGLICGKS